jgi:hypothetical protein
LLKGVWASKRMVTKQAGHHHWTVSYRDCSSKQMIPNSAFTHKPTSLHIQWGHLRDVLCAYSRRLSRYTPFTAPSTASLEDNNLISYKRGGRDFITSLGGPRSVIALQVPTGEAIYL